MEKIDDTKQLLLISNSALHGGGYLDHAEKEIRDFVGGRTNVLFVPYAVHMGEIVAGKKPGRESREEVTIFDSTGMALEDVASAAFLDEKAQRDGSGVRLDFAA